MTQLTRKPFIAGNWKMYKTIPEARKLGEALKKAAPDISEARIAIIPPFTVLSPLHDLLKGSPIHLGAQDLFWEDEGAYTGEISARMLEDAGCTYAVIGHSERREYFGETNETVNKKIKAALTHGLNPILCIGESLEERKKGDTIKKVAVQISEGMKDLGAEQARKVILAYEPIWAIGTGLTATPEQAEEVHGFIRTKLAEKYGNDIASYAIILYGGSVKPANTHSLLKEKDIDGALVGGASLEAESFIEIAKEAIKAFKEK